VAEQVPAPAQVLCRIRGGRGAQAADRENRGPSKARIPNPWSPYLREQRNVQAGWLLISFRPTPHASQGDKNGLDLSAEAKKGVEGLIAELEAINPTPNPARVDLGGTKWELVYSSTAGASGGKLGPFIGQVTQVFPAGEGEIYFNIVELGPLKAALKAEFSCESDDKLKVTFVDTTFSLGPLATTKVFEERRGGTWRMSYSDDDFRVLYANTGNVFVLRRI